MATRKIIPVTDHWFVYEDDVLKPMVQVADGSYKPVRYVSQQYRDTYFSSDEKSIYAGLMQAYMAHDETHDDAALKEMILHLLPVLKDMLEPEKKETKEEKKMEKEMMTEKQKKVLEKLLKEGRIKEYPVDMSVQQADAYIKAALETTAPPSHEDAHKKEEQKVSPPARVEKDQPTAVQQQPQGFGVISIGDMEISEAQIVNLRKIPQMLNDIFRNIMQEDTDYGVIPGTQKPTLYKAGAELLRMAFGLTYQTELIDAVENWETGLFYYKMKTTLYAKNGIPVGDGIGSANSMEAKYALRWAFKSDIPAGVDISSLKTQERRAKNGATYLVYQLPSSIYDKATLVNTLQKMADKRSFVAAILKVTGASRIFTQDLEDIKDVKGHDID